MTASDDMKKALEDCRFCRCAPNSSWPTNCETIEAAKDCAWFTESDRKAWSTRTPPSAPVSAPAAPQGGECFWPRCSDRDGHAEQSVQQQRQSEIAF